MGAEPAHMIEVDGKTFSVHFEGPDERVVRVDTRSGECVHLRRWRFDEHLRALDRHAWADERGLRFDHEGFSRDVLRDSGVPDPLHEELASLALWWATGGDREPASGVGPDGWLRIGTLRARLRPWTFSERSRAMGASLTARPDGTRELGLERYLRAMLAASVVALDPAGVELSMLDGATTAALLDVVVALNTAGERDEDKKMRASDAEGQALARLTLLLCRTLGWTPSQVWEAPAAEIDRLLAILAVTEASAPAPVAPRTPGLADHPDAVVIQVEAG
ncbi:hypothetical protein [Archangium lipolyticum]|uniref:hypothetical protein n=1 Tax=Archangium lipolyticum TaxID=2970465 RepID=UPI00214A69C7|nr:hypothetical protein [Archangium lipolyticum]